MDEKRTKIRVALLKALYDIDYGHWPELMEKNNPIGEQVADDDKLGIAGTTLCKYILRLLSFDNPSEQAIAAYLEYLTDKYLIVRRPSGRIPGSDKIERMKHSWYKINACGKDIIEGTRQEPSMPRIKQDITYIMEINSKNAIHVGSAVNSQIQQSIDSNSQQTITYNLPSNDDLKRLVELLGGHLSELKLSTSDEKKAKAQLATIEAQLQDEPNPSIVKEAVKTLRNITEGAIGSLIASAMQPTIWTTVQTLLVALG